MLTYILVSERKIRLNKTFFYVNNLGLFTDMKVNICHNEYVLSSLLEMKNVYAFT